MDASSALFARDPLGADAPARLEGQLVLLGRLSEVGMQIVEAIGAQVTARTAGCVPPAERLFRGDIVLAFSRVARAIRLTVALQFKLHGDLDAWRRGEPVQAQAAKADQDEEPESEPHEAVEAVERFDGPESGREREARDDIYALLDRPTDEVIDLIRRDLGLDAEWVRQVQAEAESDAAGLPFSAHPGAGRDPGFFKPPRPPERRHRPAPS